MRTVTLLIVAIAASPALAHFHMLIPDRHSIKKDETVTLTYQFGHPFECELFDAEKPEKARAFAPDGREIDLLSKVEKIELPVRDGKKIAAYRVQFKPASRGDHTLIFESPPVWLDDEKHYLRDSVRVVVHVQTQNGWDKTHVDSRNEFTLVPMTRPYGLRPGTVFQARVGGFPELLVFPAEVERRNPAPPKELPPDELITLAVKSDNRGVITCTLHDPGWWAICATRKYDRFQTQPTKDRDGKSYPIVERAILWAIVDDVKAK